LPYFQYDQTENYARLCGGCEEAPMSQLAQHYTDPRLVALYDIENPRGADTDFYLALAVELDVHTVLDLGCGTGLLTIELAHNDRRVIGVDPSPMMLAVARQKPGAERVHWIQGDSTALGTTEADLVIMTGNVAQVFLDDAVWEVTLRDTHAALRPGGYLAFESRNPDDRGWERWNRDDTYTEFDTPNGPMICWLELVSVGKGHIHYVGHNVFKSTGEVVVASDELRFRTRSELEDSLRKAGFTVEHLFGDWHGGSLTSNSRIMVFVARRS
jgi:SAM-dependent methyltransferase